jgi:hypothetical protein
MTGCPRFKRREKKKEISASFPHHQVLIPGIFFCLYGASEACHPERRRREGPAFSFVRRARAKDLLFE